MSKYGAVVSLVGYIPSLLEEPFPSCSGCVGVGQGKILWRERSEREGARGWPEGCSPCQTGEEVHRR